MLRGEVMEKLFKIGEVASLADTTIKTIRYYEKVNLIKPKKVDEFSGYRYFDAVTIQLVQKVQKLKQFGLNLNEIKSFIKLDRDKQFDFINKKFRMLELAKQNLLNLASHCARKIDFFFENDNKAVGKWKCIAVVKSKENYFNNLFEEHKPILPYLYFLKNGAGYDMIKGWSKGEIYHHHTYKYEIENNLMFVQLNELELQVYEKIDSIERSEPEQDFFDNVDISIESDPRVLGLWKIYDHIMYSKKEDYLPRGGSGERYFMRSLAFFPENICMLDTDDYRRLRWTKGIVFDKKKKLAMPYQIKECNDKKYLILEWKDDGYRFFGEHTWCYVFEKIG